MAKVGITIAILRTIQLALAFAFIIFWAWACAAQFAVGGGVGEYFLGFFIATVSLAIAGHGIWTFAQKKHLIQHSALYHNLRWAIDILVVIIWLAQILISILVPVQDEDAKKSLNGGSAAPGQPGGPTGSDVAAVLGINFCSLFSAITFTMTFLLLVFEAVRARRNGGAVTDPEQAAPRAPSYEPGTETTIQVPPTARYA